MWYRPLEDGWTGKSQLSRTQVPNKQHVFQLSRTQKVLTVPVQLSRPEPSALNLHFHENEIKFQISLTAQENKRTLLPSSYSEWWVGTLGGSESKTFSKLKHPRFHGLTTEMLLVFRWRNPGVALEWPLCSKCDFTPKGAAAAFKQNPVALLLWNAVKLHTNIHIRENKLVKLLSPGVFSVSHSGTHTQYRHKPSLKALFVVSAGFPLCMPPWRRLYVVIGNIWGADFFFFLNVAKSIQWHEGDCHPGKPIIWISLKPINIRKWILCGLQNSFTNISCPNYM